jgi:hypothetical protein
LSYFNEAWAFLTDFQNKLKYQTSRKSSHFEPSHAMRTVGHNDAMMLTVAFCNFALGGRGRQKFSILIGLSENYRKTSPFSDTMKYQGRDI